MYIDKHFAGMKSKVNPISSMVGMVLRIGLLCLVLLGGKFGCDYLVDESRNHVSEYELEMFTKSKLKSILELRKQGLISKEEMLERAKFVETHTKELYIEEKR